MKFTSRFLQVAGRSSLGIVVGAALVTWGTPASAGATAKGAVTYRVKPGDSLWRISRRHYGSPHHWSMLYFANREVIGPSTRILHPGMRLVLPPLPGALANKPPQKPASLKSSERKPLGKPPVVPIAAADANKDPVAPEPIKDAPASAEPLEVVPAEGNVEATAPEVMIELPAKPTLEGWPETQRLVSPEISAAASLLLPGSGQVVRGDWDRGLAHLGVTAFSLGALHVGNQGADFGLRWAGSIALVGISLWSAWDAYRAHEPDSSLESSAGFLLPTELD